MEQITEFLRNQYEVQGYHVSSITGPHGKDAIFRVSFTGRGPWGRKQRSVTMATIRKLVAMSSRTDLLSLVQEAA